MSNFDTRKFEAVCKLMREGATEGEREAAQSAAERMASKAGMTLEEALTRHGLVSIPETPRPTSIIEAMFSSPESKRFAKSANVTERSAERKLSPNTDRKTQSLLKRKMKRYSAA